MDQFKTLSSSSAASKASSSSMDPLQSSVLSTIGAYQDLYLSRVELEEREKVRDVTLLHAVNHVLKSVISPPSSCFFCAIRSWTCSACSWFCSLCLRMILFFIGLVVESLRRTRSSPTKPPPNPPPNPNPPLLPDPRLPKAHLPPFQKPLPPQPTPGTKALPVPRSSSSSPSAPPPSSG
jgi:hypothetical protein